MSSVHRLPESGGAQKRAGAGRTLPAEQLLMTTFVAVAVPWAKRPPPSQSPYARLMRTLLRVLVPTMKTPPPDCSTGRMGVRCATLTDLLRAQQEGGV